MSSLSWSIPGAVPTHTYQVGDPVWLRVAGESLPAVVTRPGAKSVRVVFYRHGRGLCPFSWVRRRRVGSDVLCMRVSLHRIDAGRRDGHEAASR
jgi:hypothetical protein